MLNAASLLMRHFLWPEKLLKKITLSVLSFCCIQKINIFVYKTNKMRQAQYIRGQLQVNWTIGNLKT